MRDEFDLTLKSNGNDPGANTKWGAQSWLRIACVFTSVITIGILSLLIVIVVRPLLADTADEQFPNSTFSVNYSMPTCTDNCKIDLLNSIPTALLCDNNSVSHQNNHDSWLELIASAQSSIDIMTYSFEVSKMFNICSDVHYDENEDLLSALVAAGRDRGVRLRIIINHPGSNVDSEYLSEKANAQVRHLNFTRLFGKGVMHTKLLLVDDSHFYVGSADISQLSVEVSKELGLVAVNCSCLANDIAKIFDGHWELTENGTVPNSWPESLATGININNPMHLTSDGIEYRTFAAISPSAMLAYGRTYDLDALVYCINKAEKFIDIATVKYFPLLTYKPNMKYWPVIDDALREAAIDRKVHIRLLVNRWEESSTSEKHFLKSLTDLTGSYENVTIEAKFFSYPMMKKSYLGPKGNTVYRIKNHNRYVVTDTAAYITTSNLAGEFFDSAGIGLIFEEVGNNNTNSIRHQLEDVFQRDWVSRYAYSLDTEMSDVKNSSAEADQ